MKSSILTAAQIASIVVIVNKKVDLPIIGEKIEEKLIEPIVESIVKVIEDKLPPKFVEFIQDALKGFDPEDKDALRILAQNFVRRLNAEVNIPLLSEKQEQQIFEIVVDILFDALQKNKNVDNSIDNYVGDLTS
jgi:hypothetical protein